MSGPGELTLTSIVLFTLGAYGVAAGAASGEQSVVAVGVFAFALFLIGIVWPIVALAGVELEAWTRTDVTVDEPYDVHVRLRGRCSRVEVRFADLTGDGWVTASPATGVLPRVASRRGVYRVLRFELRSSAPLGVFVRSRAVRVELPYELVVAPRAATVGTASSPVAHALRERPLDAPIAIASTSSPGGGDTVRTVRPYVAGDAARLVHWPTSARRGTLVVRENEPPPAVGIALVVDLNGFPDDVEDAASRAAGIGRATLDAGGAVWCCTSEPTGPVSELIRDRRDLGRRLARAGSGPPGTPPDGWPVEVVRGMSTPAAQRRDLLAPGSPWRLVAVPTAMALGSVGAIAASRANFPLLLGASAGAAAALLGVFALPSLPTRRVVVVLLGLGGLGALRHASFTGSETTPLLVLWALSTLVALLLVDRAVVERVPRLVPGRPLERRGAEITRIAVAIAAIAAVIVVAFSPTITERLGRHVWPGIDPSIGDALDAPSSLTAADSLDMTQRPRLSDRVVFTVNARRASFWRGQTFDSWDGHAWSNTNPQSAPIQPTGSTVAVVRDPYDVGAFEGRAMRQTFRMESEYSNVVFAAPSLVTVQTDKVVEGHPDGTATVYRGFGRGATYTVTSRTIPVTAKLLREASRKPVPADVLRRYASAAPTTDRVNTLASAVTGPAPTVYDKILAIEAWLGDHVKYSLDAPLSPANVDVVDDFLFRSRLGWCEQVASSLVVMARSVGIPARLATGFVPGRRDVLSGQFVVRERDAHAWAEVYFAGVGWQPFDPTASVPLAGEAADGGSWLDVARRHAFALGLLAALLVILAVAAPELRTRWERRQARKRASWATQSLDRLERYGRRAGRARVPSETPREYARALAMYLHDPRIRDVGETLDVEGFSSTGAVPSARESVDAVLSSLGP